MTDLAPAKQTFEIKGLNFEVQKWTLEDQIKNQGTVLPFLSGPVASAFSMMDSGDSSLIMAEALTGFAEALENLDAIKYMNTLFTACVQRTENGTAKVVSLPNLQEQGFEIFDAYELSGRILFVQYEALLKKGQAVLEQVKGSLQP